VKRVKGKGRRVHDLKSHLSDQTTRAAARRAGAFAFCLSLSARSCHTEQMTLAVTYAMVARWLAESRQTVAFSGAGVSTESGIPDFRSPQGVWARYRPVLYGDFLESAEARHEYWRQKAEAHRDFAGAAPNVGHTILARWEACRMVTAVVTQNIDGLHQQAGSLRVLELHGTAREVSCLDCHDRFPAGPLVELFLSSQAVPSCPSCGLGRLKHATISFGQALPASVLEESVGLSRGADLFVVIGSSLVVEPAASLPRIAKENGARLVILNRDGTPLDDIADAVLREPIGQSLAAIDERLG